MSSKITFIGDVMLSRLIGRKYAQQPYNVVDKNVIDRTTESNLIIANLESPVPYSIHIDNNHQHFIGNPNVLDKLTWIDLFSLSNNHINDSGTLGITETIEVLERKGFRYNGIFEKEYEPYIYENGDQKIAIVTFTDMLNIPFDEDCQWKTMRMDNEANIFRVLEKCRDKDCITILYAHVGMIFTRFPNPVTYDFLHTCIDHGADLIVTAHSHCLGGMEKYRGKFIFHSIGDFVMDGSSYRRRRACLLNINIKSKEDIEYEIIPTETNSELITVLAQEPDKILNDFHWVSSMIANHSNDYKEFYGRQYKKEIRQHSFSTISFLFSERGFWGLIKLLFQRIEEVIRTIKWVSTDRADVRNDQDTLTSGQKTHSMDDLY